MKAPRSVVIIVESKRQLQVVTWDTLDTRILNLGINVADTENISSLVIGVLDVVGVKLGTIVISSVFDIIKYLLGYITYVPLQDGHTKLTPSSYF